MKKSPSRYRLLGQTPFLTLNWLPKLEKSEKPALLWLRKPGTERLRRVINKGNSEEDLRKNAIVSAFSEGWKAVKLYFMIGLPTETEEDLEGIVDLSFKASRWGRARRGIRASISTFVPKSHTSFQWVPQISLEKTLRRQMCIKDLMRRKSASLKFHNPKISFLEGVFARGDKDLGRVIETAFRKAPDLMVGTSDWIFNYGWILLMKRV